MKKIISVMFTIAVYFSASAQVPQALNYQAGVYSATGMPLFNLAIKLRLSVLDTAVNGPLLYSEDFATATDVNGLFNVNMGMGTPNFGTFSSLDWSNGNKWLKTEVDTGNGTYILMGATKFLSVPYALYAEKTKGTTIAFGNWTGGFLKNTIYQATSDGFVNVSITGSGVVGGCNIANIVSDSSATPTTIIVSAYYSPGSLLAPVKKNDYWTVTGVACNGMNVTVTFLPLK